MVLSRTGESMWSVVVVLYALNHFHSPLLAGIAAAVSQIPTRLLAPLAGTLLDRHGRTRLVLLDYLLATTSIASIGVLALVDQLSASLFVAICAVAGLTNILSATGLRSLFPLLLPRPLWDRANAVDSASYVAANLVGPALAGTLVAVGGGEVAIFAAAIVFAGAVIACIGLVDPPSLADTSESVWRGAWTGLRYVLHNRTLVGLAVVLSSVNFGMGILIVALPVLVLSHLGGSPAIVGLLFTISAVAGLGSGVVFGKIGSDDRERLWLTASCLGIAAALVLLGLAGSLAVVVVAMIVLGFCNGPMDIALFSLRQRRTEPAMLGRALAISMALNGTGQPFGSLTAGVLVLVSPGLAFTVAAVVVGLSALTVYAMIPRRADIVP